MKILILLGAVLVAASPVLAHDGSFGSVEDPILIDTWDAVSVTHPDASEWKGWAFFTVKNTSTNSWGDFHFEINGADENAASVIFVIDAPNAPISSQSPLNANVGTNLVTGMSTLDLTFYNDPVGPGEIATFQVYTDNTTDQNAWFGISVWPTPVPEPMSILLLGIGGLFLARRRR